MLGGGMTKQLQNKLPAWRARVKSFGSNKEIISIFDNEFRFCDLKSV